jgi:hypothetical protein
MSKTFIYYSPLFEQICIVEYEEWFSNAVAMLSKNNETWFLVGEL